MEKQSLSVTQIHKQIQLIEQLFENKQLDEFVQRVQKFILPHYERCHHSGKYKQKSTQLIKNKQQTQLNKQQINEAKTETQKVQQSYKEQSLKQKQQRNATQQQQRINKLKQQQQKQFVDPTQLENLKEIQNKLQQLQINQQKKAQNLQQIGINQNEKQQQIKLEQQNANNDIQTKQQDQLKQTKAKLQEESVFINNQQSASHQLFQKQQIKAKQQPSKINSIPQKQTGQSKQKHLLTQSLSQQIKAAVKQSKIHILQKYDEMKLVLFKIQREMKKLQIPMTENKQWKVNKINSTSSIGVKTKGTLVQIRYQGVVQTNIFNLCVMIYLSQLYKEWVPFCSGSKTITQPSPLQKLVLMDLKIPFLTQRYAYLHGIAIDRITKNGKLYIYAEGITHQKQLLLHVHKADKTEYEKKVAKSVVFDAKYMVCQIGNEGNGKYQVKVYGMIDTHMPMLPQKIVNYIVKQLGGMIFDKIVKRAKDIKGTAWQKQLKANENRQQKNKFYDWLNQRITNWDKSQALRKSKI